MNIGQFITYMILNSNKSNSEILQLVHEKFEGCKTSAACVAWYKSKLRKEGKIEKSRTQKFSVALSEEELQQLCE
jgi:hypothetical protein